MSYIIDRTIQSYIDDERARCRALVVALLDEREFLLYCIDTPVSPNEVETHRQRFEETADDFEDLM